jgi:hypothetical protein
VVTGLEAEEVAPSLIHNDLKPLHILFDGDNVTLIDLDKCTMADPMLDVANFLFTLARASSRSHLHKDCSPAIMKAFIEEYFAHAPETWRVRLPLHYAGNLLKQAAQTLRRQAPGYSDRVETLLKEAEDSLAGRVW